MAEAKEQYQKLLAENTAAGHRRSSRNTKGESQNPRGKPPEYYNGDKAPSK